MMPSRVPKVVLSLAVALSIGASVRAQTFSDVTAASGIFGGQGSWAGAWADFDGDGFLDLMTLGHLQTSLGGKNQLWRASGSGYFSDVTASVGMLSDKIDTHSVVWADFDRDGDLDLLMLNEPVDGKPWLYNELWRNNGDGTFTDVAPSAGVTVVDHITKGLATADIDRDGLLDILEVVQDLSRVPGAPPSYSPNNLLLRNEGNLLFTDIAIAAGVAMPDAGEKRTATFADFDNDGWPDLMVMPDCSLFRNNRNLTFTEVTDSAGIMRSPQCQGAAWADYDNDGYLDVFVTKGFNVSTLSALYRNNRDGTFTDVSASAGLVLKQLSRAAVWGDYDNDGLVDLYVVNASKSGATPNRLFKNNGDGTFADVTLTTGTAAKSSGFGSHAGFVDYDDDGDLDLFLTNGEGVGTGPFMLLQNSGNGNKWIKIKLLGTVSNPEAVGTRLRLNTPTVSRLAAHSGPAHWMSQSRLPVHFGLGAETSVSSVTLNWPNGLSQTVENLAANQTVTVEEGLPLHGGSAKTFTGGYAISYVGGIWRIEWKGGGDSPTRFSGKVSVIGAGVLSGVTTSGFEAGDRVVVSPDTRTLTFSATENSTGSDVFEFVASSAAVKFDIRQDMQSQPSKVRLGKYGARPATLPLTLKR